MTSLQVKLFVRDLKFSVDYRGSTKTRLALISMHFLHGIYHTDLVSVYDAQMQLLFTTKV